MKIRNYLTLFSIIGGLAFGVASAAADCGTCAAGEKKEKACSAECQKECCAKKAEGEGEKSCCAEGCEKECCKKSEEKKSDEKTS